VREKRARVSRGDAVAFSLVFVAIDDFYSSSRFLVLWSLLLCWCFKERERDANGIER
jgi:hypothetical protein